MHRIASFGEIQESNAKQQRRLQDDAPSAPAETVKPALLDVGKVMDYTVFAVIRLVLFVFQFTWEAVAGLYYFATQPDLDALWEPTTEMFHGDPHL